MVSRQGHCLSDLLYHVNEGLIPIEVAAVVADEYRLRVDEAGTARRFPLPADGRCALGVAQTRQVLELAAALFELGHLLADLRA